VLEIRSADQSLRLAAADAESRDRWVEGVRALVARLQRAARRSKQAMTEGNFVARFPAGRVPVRLADGAQVEVRALHVPPSTAPSTPRHSAIEGPSGG